MVVRNVLNVLIVVGMNIIAGSAGGNWTYINYGLVSYAPWSKNQNDITWYANSIQNYIYLLLKLYISELECYQGSGDSPVLSSCTGSPYADRCIKETIGGDVTYTCNLASNKIIEGSVADNACSTINSDEICICSTDGCNTVSSSSRSSSMI